jgi:hypothetical protein
VEGTQAPVESLTDDDLGSSVASILAKGLPTTIKAAGQLLGLRSVFARASVPQDQRSRLEALNRLLPRLIGTIGDPVYRDAVQTLFGLAPGTRGTTLTARRRQAADILNYSASHFRAEVEDELVRAVAVLIHDDALRYVTTVRRSVESAEPTGTTPRLGADTLTHEEELISRIWKHVYGLRAELIAFARLRGADGLEAQVEDHRQAAIRERAQLQTRVTEYVATYGSSLIRHGDSEFSIDALERLAGWG